MNKNKNNLIIFIIIGVYLLSFGIYFTSLLISESVINNVFDKSLLNNQNSQTEFYINSSNSFKNNRYPKSNYQSHNHQTQDVWYYSSGIGTLNAPIHEPSQSTPFYSGQSTIDYKKTNRQNEQIASNSFQNISYSQFSQLLKLTGSSNESNANEASSRAQTQESEPFSSVALQENQSSGIGPGGDPEEPAVPIGDDLSALFLLATAYAVWIALKPRLR